MRKGVRAVDKYIVEHKVIYKVEAESHEEAMDKFSCGEVIAYDVDCYPVELDFSNKLGVE